MFYFLNSITEHRICFRFVLVFFFEHLKCNASSVRRGSHNACNSFLLFGKFNIYNVKFYISKNEKKMKSKITKRS